MAAGISNEIAGGEDARREDAAGALIGAQRQYVLGPVANVDHGGDAGVQKARQGLHTLLSVRDARLIGLDARVEGAAQMDVHVHQPRHEVLAPGVDATALELRVPGRSG